MLQRVTLMHNFCYRELMYAFHQILGLLRLRFALMLILLLLHLPEHFPLMPLLRPHPLLLQTRFWLFDLALNAGRGIFGSVPHLAFRFWLGAKVNCVG